MLGDCWFSPSIQVKMNLLSQSLNTLTCRELEVLQLARQGKSNIQIGETLNITERTVRKHFENIFQKMGVSNRTEAVMVVVQFGWIKI